MNLLFSSSLTVSFQNHSYQIPVYSCNTLVVGSGAAALNCAHTLHILGQKDICLVTEGMKMGTSRNTGSDKQTYYKISTSASVPDCARKMAEEMYSCGSMHGDIALVEALGSQRSFYKLVALGVPFPHSFFGEYSGYQTDHDASCRATSCGPLTSKFMTEALEKAVCEADIPVLDHCRIIELITRKTSEGRRVVGAVGYMASKADTVSGGLVVFSCTNVVWGVGGPSSVYATSVYPESQTCALGTAYLAGASGVNVTESQYGIASLSFRWNLSGSYQQVLPHYYSTNPDGSEPRDFLSDAFSSVLDEQKAIFRKGYEWPFDPQKLNIGAHSSLVDLCVFCETQKGRRVFMDFRSNHPELNALSAGTIGEDAFLYLSNSHSLQATPVERLRAMNEQAYQLYLSHGIDLEKEPLEIGVCAQHCNGGLENSVWFESPTLSHFFPVGEAGGTFGVKRPGGSALNDTQVSSSRAAEKIAAVYTEKPGPIHSSDIFLSLRLRSLYRDGGQSRDDILKKRRENGKRMDAAGAFLRNLDTAQSAYREICETIENFFASESADSPAALEELCINYDSLITSSVMLAAIIRYIEHGGGSRGSYVITSRSPDQLLRCHDQIQYDSEHSGTVQRIRLLSTDSLLTHAVEWMPVRPIPEEKNWFENVMNDYRTGAVFRQN